MKYTVPLDPIITKIILMEIALGTVSSPEVVEGLADRLRVHFCHFERVGILDDLIEEFQFFYQPCHLKADIFSKN